VTYEESISWLYDAQMFGIKLGLAHPRHLMASLGNPEKKLKFLHVAGTNAKGSVCAFAESILREAGRKTGLFTSPHLLDFRERIQVCGERIPQDAVVRGVEKIRHSVAHWRTPPTFFELTFALALDWFAACKVDVVILETGMGGRLDATNVVRPQVCVITTIGHDHAQWLGESLEAIAEEKAGIIKSGIPLVLMPQEPSVFKIIERKAEDFCAPLLRIDAPWTATKLPLAGEHQRWNAATAVLAAKTFLPSLDELTVLRGLEKTSWPGRFQKISEDIVLDGAHNVAAAAVLVRAWKSEFPGEYPILVFGALKEKIPEEMLKILSLIASEIRFVPVKNQRAMTVEEMKTLVREMKSSIPTTIFLTLADALAAERPKGSKFLVTGSLFLVAEALAFFSNLPSPRKTEQ